VFAQLMVDGKNEGIHGVLVNIRDKDLKQMPGVTIEDMGHKVRFFSKVYIAVKVIKYIFVLAAVQTRLLKSLSLANSFRLA